MSALIGDVLPDPSGRTLIVEVIVPALPDVAPAVADLEAAKGHLRSEVAAAISRKRTPFLQFVVLPARVEVEEGGGHD